MTGSIPTELSNLSSLRRLWLSENQLTGSIPSQLGGLSMLTQLNLHTNQLSGDIPAALGDLSDTLTRLRLGGNTGLTGCIPAALYVEDDPATTNVVEDGDLDELGLPTCQ